MFAIRKASLAALRQTVQVRAASTLHKPGIIFDIPGVKQESVTDITVNVTFVNHLGERTTLPGRVGDSLLDLATRYNYDFVNGACNGGGSPVEKYHKDGNWYEPKYGEGASCYHCHVIIPKSHYPLLPPKRPDELAQLRKYPFPADMTETSRLGCQVHLSKDMDGMVVYVPDGPSSAYA